MKTPVKVPEQVHSLGSYLEPSKAQMMDWATELKRVPRKAFVVVFQRESKMELLKGSSMANLMAGKTDAKTGFQWAESKDFQV